MKNLKAPAAISVVVLLSLLLGVSCFYSPYRLPELGNPIESVEDPNNGISRKMDGEDHTVEVDDDEIVIEECSYDVFHVPSRKIMRTLTIDGEVVFRTFETETYGEFNVCGTACWTHRYAVTDELDHKLVELRYDINYDDAPGMKPIHQDLLDLLPDVEIDGVYLEDFISVAPHYGTWEVVIGDRRSAWNASVDHMPQEIAAYLGKAGYDDLDDSDGEDGMRHYRYDLGNGVALILTRFWRSDILVDQDDMTTVTFELPTEDVLPIIEKDFHIGHNG